MQRLEDTATFYSVGTTDAMHASIGCWLLMLYCIQRLSVYKSMQRLSVCWMMMYYVLCMTYLQCMHGTQWSYSYVRSECIPLPYYPLSQIALAILGYSLCSSTLLLANKLSITYLPSAFLLAFVQIVFSTIAVLIIQFTKLSEVDTFDWERSKAYAQ